ncbi:NADH-dependent oxidoreductase [Rhodococcus pyridinivorans KG-16]|uniref:NADH-dependent oxidoreductase n=1 Tax=Rhodococcus pyridinivorans KG-16 TaxID=1441730 RepID=A0A0V9UE94_9NOCA|nr:FAD-dependent oxidoreductase [Rhodococcus pyridinivorans]KSZ56408.1 NADH-dependent oxidoreductase [Rhodococcus pyridinivorans KG-16]
MTTPAFAQPLDFGPVRLRNRFVSAPMERNYCAPDGGMTDEYIAYLERRAAGGAALVFTEASYVRADGKGRIRQMGVDDDDRIPGIARMAEALHAHGALVGVELNHGGRTAQGTVSGFVPVAPSQIPCAVVGGEMPEQLDDDDIEHIIECFGEAAARCEKAGVDVISLHGGHGYLIHQFLSPAYNKRDDTWAEPTLFVNRVIDTVRAMAPGVALGLRFSAFEGVDGGLDARTTRDRIDAIDTARLDFLDVSAGNYEAGQWIIQPGEWPRGLLAPHAAPYTRDFDIPVGVAGRINTPEAAEHIIASGQADFVSMARTLHADPEFPNRALAGTRYRPCIACNYCIDSLAAGPVPCSVNPWVGRELEQPTEPAATPVRVAVIGGGPSGLSVSRELASAGHHVALYDERGTLGGDFALASDLHEYPEYRRIVDWYLAELAELDVVCHTGVRVEAQTLTTEDFDAIVLATGGVGPTLEVPGLDTRRVRDVREYLASGDPAPDAITIFGADREAAAVADDLLHKGTQVVMIGPQETIAHDVGRRAKIVLLPRLAAAENFTAHLSSIIVRVEADHMVISTNGREHTVPAPGELLVSQGIEPRAELLTALRRLGARLGVHSVGDASGDGGSIHAANVTAADVAARITAAAQARVEAIA